LRVARALRAAEPEPVRAVVPEPVRAVVPEPVRAVVPEPVRAVVPEPVRAVVPEPVRAVVPEPVRAVVPEPVRAAVPEPVRGVASAPVRAVVPDPPGPSAPPPPEVGARPAESGRPGSTGGDVPWWAAAPGASEPGPTPGTIGWLWPEETATQGGGGGPRWRPPRRWRYRAATLFTLAAGVLVGAGLFVGIALHSTPVAGAAHPNSTPKATAGPTAGASTPAAQIPAADPGLNGDLTQAATWVSQQVASGTLVACDNQTCAALTAVGFPAAQQIQIQLNPETLANASVVVVTPAVRSYLSTNPSLGDYVTPAVLASFGQVTIQMVDLDGAAAYQTALSQDVQARIAMGEQLLNSGYISASATATSELEAGDVDSRVLLVLQALCYQEPIDVLGFGDAGPGASPGIPLRGVQLAEFDPNALVSRTAYLQVLQQVLNAQATFPAPQHAGVVPLGNGQNGVQIEYAAPSPFGLLTAG
jgi:hypothetical protein